MTDIAALRSVPLRADGDWNGEPDRPPFPDQEPHRAPAAAIDPPSRHRAVDGATFVLDAPVETAALWGAGQQTVWSPGESLMVCGPPGVGKTTLVQQVALARIGILEPSLLGMPVAVDPRPLLYIAADRPEQARRSMHRMVGEEHRDLLAERLVVWKGPPPCNVLRDQESLSIFAQEMGAGAVVIDSLKDVVPDLSKDESGSRYNIARQHLLAAGIELIENHHQRKSGSDGGKPKHLADVYGSAWITAGAGSVIVLWGEAGDAIVELLHLKQPSEQVGPHKVHHDHHTGRSTLDDPVDLADVVRGALRGINARAAAVVLFDAKDPNRNQVEKARRRLDGLVRDGIAYKEPGSKGGTNGGESDAWYPVPQPTEPAR